MSAQIITALRTRASELEAKMAEPGRDQISLEIFAALPGEFRAPADAAESR